MSSSARDAAIQALEGVRLTRVVGRPTRRNVNTSRNEIAAGYARATTTHSSFPLGSRFGFAAAVIKAPKYISLHNAAAANIAGVADLAAGWTFVHPTRPKLYPTVAANASDNTRRKKEMEQKELVGEWDTFDGYEEAHKMELIDAYDPAYLASLKHDIFGFSQVTVSEMLDHLESKCLALTNREKATKLDEAKIKWDQDDDIATFFEKLDKMEEELRDDYGITWPTQLKITHAIEEMYDSELFTEDHMMDWEDKPDADKTWVHLQAYFGTIYKKLQRYKGATSKRHGYESAANVTEREAAAAERENLANNLKEVAVAATADKEHIQQMTNHHNDMLKVVQQQQATIDKLTSTIEKQQATIEKLTAQVSKKGQTNNTRNRGNPTKKGQKKNDEEKSNDGPPTDLGCGICGMHKFTKDCYELEHNAHLRPEGWKSRFA